MRKKKSKLLFSRRSFIAALTSIVPISATSKSIKEGSPLWMTIPGDPFTPIGKPSLYEEYVKRSIVTPYGEEAAGTGFSTTPLEHLEGVITPNNLHFERSHNGVPNINPDSHEFLIHGLVENELLFSIENLLKYPMQTRSYFIECSGNSFYNSNAFPIAMEKNCGEIHGLLSTSEWTGIPLNLLLKETKIKKSARWIIAEGSDASGMTRSIPLEKALDDVIIALYQNGERIRPEQGYPMRLVVPGWEGNTSIKWLRRIKVTEYPIYSKDETSKYTDLKPDGKALQFTFPMGVKSLITKPSAGSNLRSKGPVHISGIAWSGIDKIKTVEVSMDKGKTWKVAKLDEKPQKFKPVRFRLNWQWDGTEQFLISRATDKNGNVQPTRKVWSEKYALGHPYHFNAIQCWKISTEGKVTNVYI
mgnify:CR=1 FL=1